MSPQPATQGERLVHIETLLLAIDDRLRRIEESQKQTESDLRADKADLEKWKNRGWGLIIGVGLVAGSVGAGFSKFIARFFS